MADQEILPPRNRNRPRRFAVVTVWVIAGALALAVATSLFLHYSKLALFVGGGCKEQMVSETPSPDGRMKVIIFVRDCGATTRASTHVSVVRTGVSGTGPASAEVLAGYEYPWNGKTHKIGAAWSENTNLDVWYRDDVELTNLNNDVGSVHVAFHLRKTPEPNG